MPEFTGTATVRCRRYQSNSFADFGHPNGRASERRRVPFYGWDAASIAAAPLQIDYELVMNTDEGVRQWLSTVAVYSFTVTPALRQPAEAN